MCRRLASSASGVTKEEREEGGQADSPEVDRNVVGRRLPGC